MTYIEQDLWKHTLEEGKWNIFALYDSPEEVEDTKCWTERKNDQLRIDSDRQAVLDFKTDMFSVVANWDRKESDTNNIFQKRIRWKEFHVLVLLLHLFLDNALIGDMMKPMDKLSNIFNKKPDLVVSLC